MSNLSQFLAKPIPGLGFSGTDLTYLNSAARLLVENTDAGANADYPYLLLRTDRQIANAGGAIKFQAKNSVAVQIDAGVLRLQLNTLTSTLESSQLDFSVYGAGAVKTFSFRGDLTSVVPAVAGALSLGTAALPWSSVNAGDGTSGVTLSGAVAGPKVGTVTNHQFDLVQNNAVRLSLQTAGTIQMAASLIFSSNTRRITADMDNATLTLRFAFQTSTVNAATSLGVIANGTGVSAGVAVYGSNDASNGPSLTMTSTNAAATLNSTKAGTGTTQALSFQIDGTTAMQIATNKDILAGLSGAATTIAAGLFYIQAAAGAPTGVPTVRAGYVPVYFDSTNLFLYFYTGGTWKKSTVYA